MKKHKKKIIVFLLILFISIGFAYLTTTLNIRGLIGYKGNSWDIHFENVQVINNVDGTERPVIDSNNTSVSFNVSLSEPSEYYEFSVDVVNGGTIDAMIDEVIKSGITSTNSDYLDFNVTYINGNNLVRKDLLAHGTKLRLDIVVEYKYETTALAPIGTTNFSLTLKYIQAKDDANPVDTYYESNTNNTFVLNNVKANTLTNLKIYGNTEQTQYEGYNLLNARLDTTIFANDAYTINIKEKTYYYVYIKQKVISVGTNNSAQHWYIFKDSDGNVLKQSTLCHLSFSADGEVKSNSQVIYAPEGATKLIVDLGSYWSASSSYLQTLEAMVSEGSDAKTYEPYVGGMSSPNPDYPQDIYSVSEINHIEISKNIFSKKNIMLNYEFAGSSGEESARKGWYISDYISIKPNTDYYLSGKTGNYECFYKSDKTLINCVSKDTGIITSPENASYLRINDLYTNIYKTAIIEYDDLINNPGINIFNKDSVLLNYELLDNGTIKERTGWFASDYIDVVENTYINLTNKTQGQINCFYDENYNFISYTNLVSGIIYIPDNAKYLRINGYIDELDNIYLYAASFIYNIDLKDMILNSIGDYRDYIYSKDGDWYVHREIGNYTFTSEESYYFEKSVPRLYIGLLDIGVDMKKHSNWYYVPQILSNKFKTSSMSGENSLYNTIVAFSVSPNDYISFKYNWDNIEAAINSVNGTIFYYPYNNSFEEKITDITLISQLNAILNNNLFSGTNVITITSDGLVPDIEFDYVHE